MLVHKGVVLGQVTSHGLGQGSLSRFSLVWAWSPARWPRPGTTRWFGGVTVNASEHSIPPSGCCGSSFIHVQSQCFQLPYLSLSLSPSLSPLSLSLSLSLSPSLSLLPLLSPLFSLIFSLFPCPVSGSSGGRSLGLLPSVPSNPLDLFVAPFSGTGSSRCFQAQLCPAIHCL